MRFYIIDEKEMNGKAPQSSVSQTVALALLEVGTQPTAI
jgi:hypothetical protein